MDAWRYYEITHSSHELLNPSSFDRIDSLGEAIGLGADTRVLDVGCGHAAMLLRWRERHRITGVGLDASPFHSARAIRRVRRAGVAHELTIRHVRGEDFETDERFDVACCLGASWIWNGHEGTLRALADLAKPSGVVVVGEPYWKAEPPPEYLAAEGVTRETFHDLAGCLDVARDLAMELVWFAGSTDAEWDAYEMRQSATLDAFAREHPDDPDLEAARTRRRGHEDAYLRWGRACLGWALWAFRLPG